ncbi:MAG: hypothetical protein QF685_00635 [Verrucomicrobiota bacterium]|nr:hypothetical protein [Verrucomicrobiota bacterium]
MKYNIYLDGETQGPFTRVELEAKNLPTDTPCAAENETAWDTVGAILERPEPLPLYTEGTAVGTLAGGVLAALWLGAAVFGGGMAKALLIVGCVGVLLLGVLAIVRIRNAPEFNGTPFAAIGMTLALVTLMTGLIVKPSSGKSDSSGQAKNKKEDDGKGSSGGGFGFAKARMRANRIKCVSNIKQVGGAYKAFASDNGDRYPWLLVPRDEAEQGSGVSGWSQETSTLLAQASVKASLGSAKILVSPLDPDRQPMNDQIDLANVDLRGNPVPNEGHSYGAVNGAGGPGKAADESRPGTVLTVTRNISGPANNEDSLSDQSYNPAVPSFSSTATWKGADKHPTDPRVMASLNSNAGQMGLSDGSASQSNNADLQAKTQAHHHELGGNYKGSPSGFLDTPND